MCPILAAASRAPRRVISLNGVPGPRVSPRPATATPITGLKVQHYFNGIQIWKQLSGVLLKKYKDLEVYFVLLLKKSIFGPKRSMHKCVRKVSAGNLIYVQNCLWNAYFGKVGMRYYFAKNQVENVKKFTYIVNVTTNSKWFCQSWLFSKLAEMDNFYTVNKEVYFLLWHIR